MPDQQGGHDENDGLDWLAAQLGADDESETDDTASPAEAAAERPDTASADTERSDAQTSAPDPVGGDTAPSQPVSARQWSSAPPALRRGSAPR